MRQFTLRLLAVAVFVLCFNARSFAASGTATFLGTDTTTEGNWQGTYGTSGYSIPNGTSAPPTDGSTFSQGAASLYTWGVDVNSTSALKTGAKTNIASCWYKNLGTSTPSIVFDIVVPANQSQIVTLYFFDYDKQGRSESVQVTDASNTPLGSPIAVSGTNFANGEYLVWSVTGEIHINITLVNGPNAVASGIFFGQNNAMPPPATASAYYTTPLVYTPIPDEGSSFTIIGTLTLPTGNYLILATATFAQLTAGTPALGCTVLTASPNTLNGAITKYANSSAARGQLTFIGTLNMTVPGTVQIGCLNAGTGGMQAYPEFSAAAQTAIIVQ